LAQDAPFRQPWESEKVILDRWFAGESPTFFDDFQVDSLVFATIQETAIVVRIVQTDEPVARCGQPAASVRKTCIVLTADS